MDGTLLDTEVTYKKAWQQAAKVVGIELPKEVIDSFVGLSAIQVEQRLLAYGSPDFSLDEFHEASSNIWHAAVESSGIALMPGFNELIRALSATGIKYCIVTNSLYEKAAFCLQKANVLQYFPILICRNDDELGKPDPSLFLRAAKRLETKITDCIITEDSLPGMQAAKQSGGQAIFIPSSSFNQKSSGDLADLVLNDLAELAQLLRYNHDFYVLKKTVEMPACLRSNGF